MKTTIGNENRFRIWEASLLLALCFTLVYGLWQQGRQRELAGQIIRLHVVAESDSQRDQEIKLKVRDEIIRMLEPTLKDRRGRADAAGAIEELLPAIEETARAAALSAGAVCDVSASLSTEGFPTREYEGFALPAGEYVSLRVVLGEGAGRNWWCVVFPPLCAASAQEADEAFEMLSDSSAEMIISEDGEYRVGFRVLELLERLRELFG